jgi:hypothetical protein
VRRVVCAAESGTRVVAERCRATPVSVSDAISSATPACREGIDHRMPCWPSFVRLPFSPALRTAIPAVLGNGAPGNPRACASAGAGHRPTYGVGSVVMRLRTRGSPSLLPAQAIAKPLLCAYRSLQWLHQASSSEAPTTYPGEDAGRAARETSVGDSNAVERVPGCCGLSPRRPPRQASPHSGRPSVIGVITTFHAQTCLTHTSSLVSVPCLPGNLGLRPSSRIIRAPGLACYAHGTPRRNAAAARGVQEPLHPIPGPRPPPGGPDQIPP